MTVQNVTAIEWVKTQPGSFLREWIERIRLARRYKYYCPANRGDHHIPEPVVKTGGQGRPMNVFGHCVACGRSGYVIQQ